MKSMNTIGRCSSVPRATRERDGSDIKRHSHIPRPRFSAGFAGRSSIPASVTRPRSLSRSSLTSHSSKLRQIIQRASITGKRTVKDTRPLSEKWYMQKTIQQLQEFLTETGYTFPHGAKILHNPTTKGFFHIFEFLYQRLDPEYRTTEKPEEILHIIKMLHYPFAIKKSHLLVVGRQNWPVLLGLLVWLKDVAQYLDKFDVKTFMISENEFEGVETQYLLQKQMAENYQEFLNTGNKYYEETLRKLAEELYGSPEDLAALEDERDELDRKLIEIEEKIEQYEEAKKIINNTDTDLEELQNHIDEMIARTNQKEKEIQTMEKEKQEKFLELEKLKEEVNKLEEVYQAQEMSTENAEYVAVQKSYLTKNIDDNKDTLEKAKKELWEEEMASARRIEQLKNRCSDVNKKYQQLKCDLQFQHALTIPEFEFSLSADPYQYKHWTEVVKPALETALETLKSMLVKNENILTEEQNVKKEWTLQITEQKLELQLIETKLEQQKKLQEPRRQEMENENASLLQKYNDLNEKAIKLRHLSTKGQQQLRDEVRAFEKRLDEQIDDDKNYHVRACAELQQALQDIDEFVKKIKEKETEAIAKFEKLEDLLNEDFNNVYKQISKH